MSRLWVLPDKPGTVIAVGAWWYVALEPYNDRDGELAWELLPPANEEVRRSMERAGVKSQCVYSGESVWLEADQEGGYYVISEPVQRPYGPHLRTRPRHSDDSVREEEKEN